MIPTGPRAAPPPLTTLTINLPHGGITSELVGRDQHLEERLTMVVRELRTLDADVVGVQEASRGRRRGDVAARLASALGFHHVYAPAAHRWPLVSRVLGLEEGPAVLSRFPIVTSHAHPIDGCGGVYRRGVGFAPLPPPPGRPAARAAPPPANGRPAGGGGSDRRARPPPPPPPPPRGRNPPHPPH